ncbi:MAG: 30S ribosomal protein S4 [Candidatus Paceibacterota bacterium]
MSGEPKCKKCRRAGTKLFLKGEKCTSPKCPLVKKDYPPGEEGEHGGGRLSEYGKELREKQKLKHMYNLSENKFRNYVEEVLEGNPENFSESLIRKLEQRLDNVIFRLGLAKSRAQARQLVTHGHFSVNGDHVNVPSRKLEEGDKVSIRSSSSDKNVFKNLKNRLEGYNPPSWLNLDQSNFEGEVIGSPSVEDLSVSVKVPSIFEFYSR